MVLEGYYGDAAITVPVGQVSAKACELCRVTEDALYEGIRQIHPKNRLSDISHAIQRYVEARGFSVVRSLSVMALASISTRVRRFPTLALRVWESC